MCKGRWQNINQNTYIYCGNDFNLQAKNPHTLSRLFALFLYCVQNKDDHMHMSNWNEYWMVSNFWSMKKKTKTDSMRRVNTGVIWTCYGKRGWTKLTIQTFFHQNLPFECYKAMLQWTTCLTTSHNLHTSLFRKVSVDFTSSQNVVNDFAEEWRFHTNFGIQFLK